MAVTMVIGNSEFIRRLIQSGKHLASVIANESQQSDRESYYCNLIELGLVLFIVTTIINLIGKLIIRRWV